MKKKDHPKISIIGGIIILSIVGILAIHAYLLFVELNEKQVFNLPKLAKPYNITEIVTTTENGETREFRTSIEKFFEIDMILITTSLSVNNPIHVKANFVFPEVTNEQWDSFDEFIILVFPKAYDDPESQNFEASGGMIKMKKSPNVHNYYGNTDIMYPLEGDYGYTLVLPKDADKIEHKKLEGDIGEISVKFLGLDKKVQKETLFHVYASPPGANLDINQIGQALTYVIISIGAVQLRIELIKGLIWLYEGWLHFKS